MIYVGKQHPDACGLWVAVPGFDDPASSAAGFTCGQHGNIVDSFDRSA